MRAQIVQFALGARDRRTVISGDQDNRVFQFATLAEDFNHLSEMRIEPFDFHEIVE